MLINTNKWFRMKAGTALQALWTRWYEVVNQLCHYVASFLFLADPVEAMGCSTITAIIKLLIHPFPLTALRCRHG